jgi:hypothetical protein
MNLENECSSKRSQRPFELFFSLITGSVGVFFAFVFIWLLNAGIKNHRVDGFAIGFLSILFLIAYWFLKLTYKLAFNKCEYLLSTPELRITGWFFMLFPPCAATWTFVSGQDVSTLRELIPTIPGCVYGFIALKVAKKRKISANSRVDLAG